METILYAVTVGWWLGFVAGATEIRNRVNLLTFYGGLGVTIAALWTLIARLFLLTVSHLR